MASRVIGELVYHATSMIQNIFPFSSTLRSQQSRTLTKVLSMEPKGVVSGYLLLLKGKSASFIKYIVLYCLNFKVLYAHVA